MQNVSEAWKTNQRKTLVDESLIEISIDMADPDALADSQASDNGSEFFSNTAQIVSEADKNILPYAMLERNLWKLNGGTVPLTDDYGDTGFVSPEICAEDGIFSTVPIITVTFGKVYENPVNGVTITWSQEYDEYAADFVVTVYNGSEIVKRNHITDNRNAVSVIIMDYYNYDKITVEINKWIIGKRRARIGNILIGTRMLYTKSDLLSFTQEMISSPLSASLPKYSATYEIDNVNNDYDPNNLSGLYKYLIERQKVSVRYGYNLGGETEWISGGKYYMSQWSSPQNGINAIFTARDTLEFMNSNYTKGLYRPEGISLYELAEQVLLDAGLPLNEDGGVNWHIGETLKSITTTAPLPVDTHANCLQLIANAACCVMYYDRIGRLYIEPVRLSDPDPFAEARAADNRHACYSNTAQIITKDDKDYNPLAALENNIWALDESLKVLSSDSSDTGFVSEVFSSADGRFSPIPIVTIDFPQVNKLSSSGLTIAWSSAYNEYASDFILSAYNGNNLVSEKIVTDNEEPVSTVEMHLQNYNRIVIEIINWALPGRRARIESIGMPVVYEITLDNSYTKPEIVLAKPLAGVEVSAYSHFYETDIQELFNGAITVSGTKTVFITYSQAAVNIKAEVTGGTLISAQYYTYMCALTITSAGNVNILVTGNSLQTSETIFTASTGKIGNMQALKNALVTSAERALALGEWARDYLALRRTLSSDWRADPRLDPLDIVSHENNYAVQPVRMTYIKYSYNGAFRGSGEGRALNG